MKGFIKLILVKLIFSAKQIKILVIAPLYHEKSSWSATCFEKKDALQISKTKKHLWESSYQFLFQNSMNFGIVDIISLKLIFQMVKLIFLCWKQWDEMGYTVPLTIVNITWHFGLLMIIKNYILTSLKLLYQLYQKMVHLRELIISPNFFYFFLFWWYLKMYSIEKIVCIFLFSTLCLWMMFWVKNPFLGTR